MFLFLRTRSPTLPIPEDMLRLTTTERRTTSKWTTSVMTSNRMLLVSTLLTWTVCHTSSLVLISRIIQGDQATTSSDSRTTNTWCLNTVSFIWETTPSVTL